jgi:hypothetical protein
MFTDAHVVVFFVRPVWWIDHRFHWNNYRQAQAVMMIGTVIHLIGFAMVAASPKVVIWGKAAFLLSSVCYGNMALGWWKKLEKASRSYERDPDAMTFERAFFYWQTIPPLRLLMLIFGLMLFAMMLSIAMLPHFNWLRDLGAVLFNGWAMLTGIGLYVAAVPPSHRPRREKKAKEQEWALPVMTSMGA